MAQHPPLACRRCKDKKLKCDKSEPCARCTTAQVVCTASERKARASRRTREAQILTSLSTRLGHLECALDKSDTSRTEERQSPSIAAQSKSPPSVHTVPPELDDDIDSSDTIGTGWLKECLVTALALSLKRSSERGYVSQDYLLFEAMASLNAVLTENTGSEMMAADESLSNILSTEEAKRTVIAGFEALQGEFLTSCLDTDFMSSLANVVASEHIHVDPAIRLVYYNLLYHGYISGRPKEPTTAQRLYFQCRKALKVWQKAGTSNIMDFVASVITSWTANHNLDKALAWNLHARACNFVRALNWHVIDGAGRPADGDDSTRNKHRAAYWDLVIMDLMFRLNGSKPSCLSKDACPDLVNLPSITDLRTARPVAQVHSYKIVWIRSAFIAKSFFELNDRLKDGRGDIPDDVNEQLDSFSDEILTMIDDWRLPVLMAAEGANPIRCSQYADVLIGSLTVVLGMERLRQAPLSHRVSARSVRAARMILDAIVKLDTVIGEHDPECGMRTYNAIIYAFRPFLALFHHVLDDPDDQENYREDWLRMDCIGRILARAATSRVELKSISLALTALTQVASCLRPLGISPSSGQAGKPFHMHSNPATTAMQPPEFMTLEDHETGSTVPSWATDSYPQSIAAESFYPANANSYFQSTSFGQSMEAGLSCDPWRHEWWQEQEMISY